jgi:hypothetical protein
MLRQTETRKIDHTETDRQDRQTKLGQSETRETENKKTDRDKRDRTC